MHRSVVYFNSILIDNHKRDNNLAKLNRKETEEKNQTKQNPIKVIGTNMYLVENIRNAFHLICSI